MSTSQSKPDELVSLCLRWLAVNREYDRLSRKDDEGERCRWAKNSPSNKFYSKNVHPLVKRIEKLRPRTLAGVAAKAQFIKVYYEHSQLEDARPFLDELIALGAKKAA
jgi:hypothetical protein